MSHNYLNLAFHSSIVIILPSCITPLNIPSLAEILETPFEELITKIISENKQLMKWINLNPLSEAA